MKTYRDGQSAPYGLYYSFRPLDVRFVGSDGEALDGLADASYRRMPTLLAIAAAPALGGVFVMAFPVLIIAATLAGLVRLVGRKLSSTADTHPELVRSRWEPAAAYLNKSGEGEAGKKDEEVEALREEVEARRSDEEDAEK